MSPVHILGHMNDGHVNPTEGTIEAAFWRFHEANPQVYTRLVELARAWKKRRGGKKLGIGMLFEVLRWEVAMRTAGDQFKLNNNYRSLYARLIMDREADLAGIFDTRRLHTQDRLGAAA